MLIFGRKPLKRWLTTRARLRAATGPIAYMAIVAPDAVPLTKSQAMAMRDAARLANVVSVKCRLETMPVDADPLGEHCTALLAYEAQYADAKETPTGKRKHTEFIGEGETTMHMAAQHGTGDDPAVLLWGFAPGRGFDQVWYAEKSDTYIIVEAKGPGATLSTKAAKGAQMSRDWVQATLEEKLNSEHTEEAVRDVCEKMLGAMRRGPPPHVVGRVVQAQHGGGATEIACPDQGIYHANRSEAYATTE